jgi:uncharacterized Zn finger protein (UPF0148 family)
MRINTAQRLQFTPCPLCGEVKRENEVSDDKVVEEEVEESTEDLQPINASSIFVEVTLEDGKRDRAPLMQILNQLFLGVNDVHERLTKLQEALQAPPEKEGRILMPK